MSLSGARLSRIIEIAHQIGFQARPLRVDLEDLRELETPCVLHWDLNHFVVLSKFRRGKAVILDPAIGERRLSLSEVSDHFTGVALELSPTQSFVRESPPPTISIRQLTGRIKGLWPALSQVLALSLALQLFVMLAPFYMQWIVDQVLVSADRDLLAVISLGFGLALLLQIGIGFMRGWSVIFLSTRLGLQWATNVFAHLLRLPLGYFEKRHLGDVTSRMSSIQSIQQILTTSFIEAIIDGLMASVTLVLMLVYSWKLALVTVSAVALYITIRWFAYRPVRDSTERMLVAGATQQSHLLESLRGMQSLKLAGEEASRRAKYQNLMVNTVNNEVRLARLNLGFNTASHLVFGAERIAVIWMGAALALQSVFSVGMLIAYLAYKELFATRAAALIDKWIEFRMLRLHGERLADIVLTRPESDDNQALQADCDARIEVENLSFRYSEGEPWVLRSVSFTVQPGESVALSGPSGGGKTTLVKVMLGLLEPVEGTVKIGGIDMHQSGARNLRRLMGAVMQDDQLFAGSIAENISFFDAHVDQERVEQAAKMAAIHDEICEMPMGYHSLIGDMGSSLSGGQKQRVILARALYRQPKILFLDEATSHLDVANEHLVNVAVSSLDITRVIVAHRPETIASADRRLTLDAGRVQDPE